MADRNEIAPLTSRGKPLGAHAHVDVTSYLTLTDADAVLAYLGQLAQVKKKLRLIAKRQTEAGRYTLNEVAAELAKETRLNADRWRNTILDEVRAGKLPLKNPKDYTDSLPYKVPKDILAHYEQVSRDDVNKWLKSHPEWKVSFLLSASDAPASKAIAGVNLKLVWIAKARAAANKVALRRWTSGEREITARKVSEAVAKQLANDSTTWGKQGARSSNNIRTIALKGWKFALPDPDGFTGLDGSDGSDGSAEN